jgi:hypothetical protein
MLLTGDSDLHENDYRVTKPWWTYLSTKLRSDLAPVWQEVRFMSRREALKEMEDRALHTKTTILLMAVGEWAILAGPGWATPPTLDGGEWTNPA